MQILEEFFRQFDPSSFVLNPVTDPSAALVIVMCLFGLYLLVQIRDKVK